MGRDDVHLFRVRAGGRTVAISGSARVSTRTLTRSPTDSAGARSAGTANRTHGSADWISITIGSPAAITAPGST